MAKIGVLIEIEDGKVKESNLGVITAAHADGGNVVLALLMEGDAEAAKDMLAEYGAHKIIQITGQGADLAASADFQARVTAEAAKHFELDALLGLASIEGRDVFARLAAHLNVPLAVDCVEVDFAQKTVKKSHFSGKTNATLKLDSELLLCALRPNAIEAKKAPVEAQAATFDAQVQDPGLTKVIEVKKGTTDKIDLTEANIIITCGRPITEAENFKMLEDCAAAMGQAAVGASRAVVDAGFAPHAMQVGQTGKTVSPKLYIACGLSGSVQHYAGMKTSKVIVAVNTDKDAPIFTKCDYGILGDMFEVVPMLTEVLKEQANK